jgi:RNA polymerase sigma-70 factor (ECF subfamily)
MNPISAATSAPCLPREAMLAAGQERRAAEAFESSRWFEECIQPHERDLRAYLRGRFPSLTDIDDLIQETYARLLRARMNGQLREVRPYLFATARNAAVDLCRRGRQTRTEQLGNFDALSVVEQEPNAAEILSHNQEIDLLHEAIRALPERCRQVLTLRRFHGLSHREIAGRLGIAEKTVDAQLCIGVFRCREFLAARGVSRERFHQAKHGGIGAKDG